MAHFPPWIRQHLETGGCYAQVEQALHDEQLHTVCQSARCPNRASCWKEGAATFMILGNICTRHCAFCAVASGAPEPVSENEPERVARAVRRLRITYAVITSVTRDDLPLGGADHFRRVIEAARAAGAARVEVLTPDFQGDERALDCIREAAPDVFNHNLETVERLQAAIRPAASWRCSLEVLRRMAASGTAPVKSGLMAGLGETDAEIREAIDRLADAGCSILTVGQYLAPTRSAWPVARFVHPEVFDEYAEHARRQGIKAVASAPLVRSSYRAEALLREARA